MVMVVNKGLWHVSVMIRFQGIDDEEKERACKYWENVRMEMELKYAR